MPQNKPMKIQWITVNGRQVPLVLPQVWNEGKQEWVVTSEYNPLPTADTNVKAELESIKQTQQQILQRLNQPINTQLTGSYVGYSNETKPTGKKGETFLELDTLDVYVHDGSGWVKIT